MILASDAQTNEENLVNDIQQHVCDRAALPLPEAKVLPSEAYTSEAYFRWERDNILKKQWLSVAHISQIQSVGDYLTVDLFDEPLVVVNSGERGIHVLSRVCAHRGMDILPPEYGHKTSGNCKQFRCPYHHWVFDLDGSLKGAPFMKEHPDIVSKTPRLHEIRSSIWEGFIFINLDGNATQLTEQFSTISPAINRWHMNDLELVADIEWDCDFNWKVLVENFMEPYHHAGAHHTIFQPILPAQNCWSENEGNHTIVCHLPLEKKLQKKVLEGEPQLVDFHIIETLKQKDFLEWTVYLGAPTFLLFVAVDRVYWYRLQPNSAGKMVLRTTLLLHPKAKEVDNYETKLAEQIKLMRDFHMEDMEMCSSVQKGLNSKFYQPGPLSELEKPIWQFQRYLARQITRSKTK